MSVVRLVVSNNEPQGRACQTCRYSSGNAEYMKCGYFDCYCNIARSLNHLCGPECKSWDRRPPNTLRAGILPRFWRWLIG